MRKLRYGSKCLATETVGRNIRLKMDFFVALAFILAAAAVIVWITKPH
jgi:hypothetical protein